MCALQNHFVEPSLYVEVVQAKLLDAQIAEVQHAALVSGVLAVRTGVQRLLQDVLRRECLHEVEEDLVARPRELGVRGLQQDEGFEGFECDAVHAVLS